MLKSRIQAWVDSSHGLAKADQWLVPVLQGLGRLDRDLFDETPTITANLNAQRTAPHTVSDYQVDQFDRYIYQSFLWVLAAYELVRTLDEICRADHKIYGHSLTQDVNQFKHQIERLRIPLAKPHADARRAKKLLEAMNIQAIASVLLVFS